MTNEWRDDLTLRLEDFVDRFVVKGAKQVEVYDAIQIELAALKAAMIATRIQPMTTKRWWSNRRTTGQCLKDKPLSSFAPHLGLALRLGHPAQRQFKISGISSPCSRT